VELHLSWHNLTNDYQYGKWQKFKKSILL